MRIYFARHGESQANQLHIISNRNLPHGLTVVGREQARQLAGRLQGHPIQRIYSSPLLRAVETSVIIAGILDLEYEQVDSLREFDCGVAESRSDKAAWQLWQAEYDAWVFRHDYTYQIEGGESFQDVQCRFQLFIERLISIYSTTPAEILCVSHGGLYSVMLPLVVQNINPATILKYGFGYTSTVVVQHTPGGWVCIEWDGSPIS